jgi:hypothetical protein
VLLKNVVEVPHRLVQVNAKDQPDRCGHTKPSRRATGSRACAWAGPATSRIR